MWLYSWESDWNIKTLLGKPNLEQKVVQKIISEKKDVKI